MGTDINGWVEVQAFPEFPDDPWVAVVDIGVLLGRDYDLFGCLFGVMNFAHFRPLVPLRGLPLTASTAVQQETAVAAAYDTGLLWPTWISLPEIQAMDLNEPALHADSRIWQEPLSATEPVRNGSKSRGHSSVMPPIGEVEVVGIGMLPIWPPDLVWEERGLRLRTGILTRREALTEAWWRVVRIMEVLAEPVGPEHVRLVVWFDR